MTNRWDALTDEVVHLFAHVADRFNRDYEDAAARFDLTSIQAKVLVLAQTPTPMHQIADRLGSERSNVTGIIDRLEARGLVERRADDRDRRIKNVVVTPAGQEAARNFQRALQFAGEPLAGLTHAERTQLRDLLRRLQLTEGEPETP
jgi:DNA-binding MarR family transcriptional regulator